MLAVLDAQQRPPRIVMHCFSGDAAFARECLDRGAYLSFAGTVTFKNNGDLRDALAITPLDRVLVETDAPYLTPMPLRGRPNGSYLIPHTARFLAETLDVDLGTLCRAARRQRRGSVRRVLVVELSELLRRRRMVRDYDPDRPVAPEQIEAVLAAMLRGSVGRLHPGRLAAGADRGGRAGGLLGGHRPRCLPLARPGCGRRRW